MVPSSVNALAGDFACEREVRGKGKGWWEETGGGFTSQAFILAGRVHGGRYPQVKESLVMNHDSVAESKMRPSRIRRMSRGEGRRDMGSLSEVGSIS